MSDKEISLGRLFVQEAVKAGTWGIIFLVIMGMFFISIKQEVKEGVAFGVDRLLTQTILYATHPVLVKGTKQLIKEGIEYSLTMAGKEARSVLNGEPAYVKDYNVKGAKRN